MRGPIAHCTHVRRCVCAHSGGRKTASIVSARWSRRYNRSITNNMHVRLGDPQHCRDIDDDDDDSQPSAENFIMTDRARAEHGSAGRPPRERETHSTHKSHPCTPACLSFTIFTLTWAACVPVRDPPPHTEPVCRRACAHSLAQPDSNRTNVRCAGECTKSHRTCGRNASQ